MENEKRVMIAFALSFVLLLLWRVMFVKTPPPAPKPSEAAHATGQQPAGQKGTEQPAAKPEAPKLPPAPKIPVSQGQQAQDIVVENDFYRIIFSTQGGV